MSGGAQGFISRVLGRSPKGVSSFDEVITNRLVRVVYQPIVELSSRQVLGYEALARSLTPLYDGPVALFNAAVQAGKCGELGRLLRMMSVDGCTEFPLFINVNPNEFAHRWLVQPDDPLFWHEHPVFMEITESVPLNHFALCQSVIAEIRSKGVRLAIDDLGAGFSNLKYISDLAPDIVKVDRELVAGLVCDGRQHQLLKSIVRLCEQMGAAVVAEGIETQDEFHAVRDAGVQYGQGYLFARPDFPPPKPVWPE